MTESTSVTPIDPADLDRLVRAAEPAARLVERRLLRRVIRRHLDMPVSANPAPHERCFWIDRAALEEVADPEDIGLRGDDLPVERILLLPRPEATDAASALRQCWRALFHARIDRALQERLVVDTSDAQVRAVFDRLGPTTVHEIRDVLAEEGLLIPPASDRDVLREFAAYFFELLYFDPTELPEFLPGLAGPDEAVHLLEPFVDAQAIFDVTRLGGAAPAPVSDELIAERPAIDALTPPTVAEREHSLAEARKAASVGNDVRAAICFLRADETAAAAARLHHLIERLQRALRTEEAERWQIALGPLLVASAEGSWPVAARLLYDLQKVCIDSERTLYAVDLIEWVVSVGTKPVKRQLDKPREVNLLRHLRSAARHLERFPLPPVERELLTRLLREQMQAAEARVRGEMGPIIAGVLDEVGLAPANVADKVSRDKLVAELLDRICARGFIRMGDLRDALARNRLKLPDLSGPVEFLRGDPLLRANRLLALRLDGVYQRGEIYLRGMQRFSSLAFGTRLGRFLTRYVALPFGGAFIILEGVHHLVLAAEGGYLWLAGHYARHKVAGTIAGVGAAARDVPAPSWATWPAVLSLGIVLLGLLYWPAFRHRVGRGLRAIFVELPTALARSPVVRAIVINAVTRFVGRYLLVPILMGGLLALALRLFGIERHAAFAAGAGFVVLTGVLFRTTVGRALEERLNDTLSHIWQVVAVNFILGAITLILDIFRALMEMLERALYAIDEKLRFREGEGPLSFWFKLIAGFVWFWVTYVVRFCINLLLEPQINPVKHFPVVTVSHKLLLPLIPSLASTFKVSIETTTLVVSGIPGIFGFLVWELKENWRLYKANRSPNLEPATVGSHGERIRGLLRPGFHSGVVPKTYAKLRKALRTGNHRKAHKHEHTLHHTVEAIGRFVEREFLASLRMSRRWGGLQLHLDDVALSPHRIRLRFALGNDHGPLVIAIEECAGWLFASLEEPGWLDRLNPRQRAAFTDALAGLYALAGIDLVREQAAATLGESAYSCAATPGTLIVTPPQGPAICYEYGDGPDLIAAHSDRTIAKQDLIFSERPLAWDHWAERWQEDDDGKSPVDPLVPGWKLLPEPS